MDNRARYHVEEAIISSYGKMTPDMISFYDSYTNRQMSFNDVADLLNQLTDKPKKKDGDIVNLTLNFYGSDMTLDKVMEIIERTTRESLQ